MSDHVQPIGETLAMQDADVLLYRAFFNESESKTIFAALVDNIHWTQQHIKVPRVPGGKVPLPRLIAWYGDAGKSYSYSGITAHPEAWTPLLLAIRERVEMAAGIVFNSVLLNLYRNHYDSVAWHSDDEPELGPNPVIASVSFGATRQFQFKHKQKGELRVAIDLTPGSLLLMRGTTQHYWKHQIPKTKIPQEPRLNLTFRVIKA